MNRAGRIASIGAAIGAAVISTGVAYAATVGSEANPLGGASATVTSCGSTSNWAVTYHQDTNANVTGLLISGIPSTCNGQTLNIALRKGTAAPVATGSATITNGQADVTTLSSSPAYTAVDTVDAIAVGS